MSMKCRYKFLIALIKDKSNSIPNLLIIFNNTGDSLCQFGNVLPMGPPVLLINHNDNLQSINFFQRLNSRYPVGNLDLHTSRIFKPRAIHPESYKIFFIFIIVILFILWPMLNERLGDLK